MRSESPNLRKRETDAQLIQLSSLFNLHCNIYIYFFKLACISNKTNSVSKDCKIDVKRESYCMAICYILKLHGLMISEYFKTKDVT